MNKLVISQMQLENSTRTFAIKNAIVICFERTKTIPFEIESMVQDIDSEFPRLSQTELIDAIRLGSLGKYGRTYKLCTQEVCIWIREFLKAKHKKNIEI